MECFISPIPGPDNLQRLEGLGIPFARTVPLPGQEGVQFDESYLATVLAATLLEETGRKALGSGIVQITTRSATVSQLPPGAVKDEVPEMLRSPAHAHIQTVLAEFGRLHALRIIHGYGAGYCQPARIEPGVLYVWI